MFEQTFLNSGDSARRSWPVAFSFAAQVAFTGLILIIPLMHTAELAWRPAAIILYAPPRPIPPPVMQQTSATPAAVQMLRQVFRPVFTAPRRIPTSISLLPDPAPSADLPLSTATGATSALPFGVPVIGSENKLVSQSQPVAAAPKQSMIRVSNGVQAAKLLAQPKPAYPPLAKAARVSGKVHLQAIIGRDGTIRNLQLIGGPSLLIAAALDAVQRWVYRPTLLNGEPVEVFTEIEVNFTLNQ